MASHRFVTHLTGFATLFGVDLANQEWLAAMSMISVPLFFIGGVMVSAWLTERRISQGKSPHYATAMGLVTLCLFLAGLGGYLDWFGKFGGEPSVKGDYIFLALLCSASGLQNAIVTSYSGAAIRTTHLTGITTDLGIGLVRILFPSHTDHGKIHTPERLFEQTAFGIHCIIHTRGRHRGFLVCPLWLSGIFITDWHRPVLRIRRRQNLAAPTLEPLQVLTAS